MVPTIKFKATKTGVEHDGVSMIVMNKGKKTEAPAGAEEMLRKKGYIGANTKVEEGNAAVAVESLDEAIARADAAEAKLEKLEAESAETFELGGYTLTASRGGWWELTGPEGFKPEKGRLDDAKARLIKLIVEDAMAPSDEKHGDGATGGVNNSAPPET